VGEETLTTPQGLVGKSVLVLRTPGGAWRVLAGHSVPAAEDAGADGGRIATASAGARLCGAWPRKTLLEENLPGAQGQLRLLEKAPESVVVREEGRGGGANDSSSITKVTNFDNCKVATLLGQLGEVRDGVRRAAGRARCRGGDGREPPEHLSRIGRGVGDACVPVLRHTAGHSSRGP